MKGYDLLFIVKPHLEEEKLNKLLDLKTQLLVSKVAYIHTIATSSEAEAFILESQLIKQYLPRFNILLKDDKSYPYIKITINEPYPRILVVRDKLKDNALYFGPYPSIGSTKFLQRTLYDIFPIRDCSQFISLDEVQKKCIKLDIGKCIGPCVLKNIRDEYLDLVQQLILFLSGKSTPLIDNMKIQMERYSKDLLYEKAAIIRDRLKKLAVLQQRYLVQIDDEKDYLVLAIAENDTFFYIVAQSIIKGCLLYQQGFYSDIQSVESRSVFIQQSVVSLLTDFHFMPEVVLADSVVGDSLKSIISTTHFFNFSVFIPQRGLKRDLVGLAAKIIKYHLTTLIQMKKHYI